ncbi:hypothetical protein FXO38_15363 [Capsicum annuum]|nr:hypothetical protein FXO38_15363 [Capsicum annuum]
MLWNPSTRKVRRFRRSDAYNDNPNNELFKTVYGFGYDELTDDYEVVEIISPRSTCTISIYSVRRKCWKRLSDSPKSVDEYCYLVNGALHWQAHNRESNDLPSSILSINLSTEAYQELNFPQHEDQLSHDEQMDTRIGVLKDCLVCLFQLFFRSSASVDDEGIWYERIVRGHLSGQTGEIARTDHFRANSVCRVLAHGFKGRSRVRERFVPTIINSPHEGCGAALCPSARSVADGDIWVVKRVKRRELTIFEPVG